MSIPNEKNRKIRATANYRFSKTCDPNYEPWVTMEEVLSFATAQRAKAISQNRSSKGV